MIIQSTTLDTEAKVKAIYGANTQWISHSGYVLRGATSGVVANDNVKTGGSDTHTITESELPSHNHSIPALSGTAASNGSHQHYEFRNTDQNYGFTAARVPSVQVGGQPAEYNYSIKASAYTAADTFLTGSAGAHIHSVTTNASTTGSKGSGSAMSILNSYKSVYIWERIA